MNILELKRKALGFVLRDPGDAEGGDTSSTTSTPDPSTPDYSSLEGIGINPASVNPSSTGDSPSNAGISDSSGFDGGDWGGFGGWSFGGVGNDPSVVGYVNPTTATVDDGKAKAINPTADAAEAPADAGMMAKYRAMMAMTPRDEAAANGLTAAQATLAAKYENGQPMSFADKVANMFSPDLGSAAYKAGIRAPGTSVDSMMSSETPQERDTRMKMVANTVESIGNFAMPGPMKMFASAVRAVDRAPVGTSTMEALGNWGKDTLAGLAAGKINGIVGQALGPGLGQVSQAVSIANAFGAGIPNVNPGGIVSRAIFGAPATQYASKTNATPSADASSTQTASYTGPSEPRSPGGSNPTGAQRELSTPAAAATPDTSYVSGRFDFDTAGWAKAVTSASAARHNIRSA